METYKETAIKTGYKLGGHAKNTAKIHGYKVAKLGAQWFIIGCKELLKQGVLVVKEMVKPGSTRRY